MNLSIWPQGRVAGKLFTIHTHEINEILMTLIKHNKGEDGEWVTKTAIE